MDWLFKEDDYIPEKEKNRYIEKSMSSMLKVISAVRNSYNNKDNGSFIYRVDPSIKLFSTLAIVFLLALSRKLVFTGLIDLILILVGFWQLKKDFVKPFIFSVTMSLFSLVILIPSILLGNYENSAKIVMKVLGAAGFTALLSNTAKWDDLSRALKVLLVPDIFIFTMETALKYINVLGESALEMFYAFKVRNIGRNSKRYTGLSAIGGNLFLKSREMSEEMYSAMECRGFTGEYSVNNKVKFTIYDFLYIILNFAVIILFIWQEVIK